MPNKKKAYDFFNKTENYLSANFVIQKRKDIIGNHLHNKKFRNIIDIGCGNGEISIQFLNESSQLTLVDISENMLDAAKSNIPDAHQGQVTYIQSDTDNLKLAQQKFDLIICTGLLAHVPNIDSVLHLISDISDNDAVVFLQNTNSNHFYTKIVNSYRFFVTLFNKKAMKHNRVSNKRIAKHFAQNGFSKEYQYNYISSFMFLSRFLSNKNKNNFLNVFFGHYEAEKHQKLGNESLLVFKKKYANE